MPLSSAQVASFLLIPPLFLYFKWKRRAYPLPPGPKGWPIIGNALDIPLESMAPVYASWAKKSDSGIVSATALGKTVVIVDSYDVAVELLDRRAAKYSSRPVSIMVGELMGWSHIFALMPYSDRWKDHRKRFVQFFRPATADGTTVHTPRAYEFVRRLVLDISETPNEFFDLVRHMVGGLAISLAYGLPIQRRNDPLVAFADSIARILPDESIPGKHLVEVLPALKYLPSWFPGAGFKRHAQNVRWMADDFKMQPYQKAVEAFASFRLIPRGAEGTLSCFVSESLASLDDPQEAITEVVEIQDVAATIYGTAADTTTDAILTFIFALATHPEFRKNIQAEADSVLTEESGALRLPTLEDQGQLPLLTAAVMESQRWAPILPIGVPHRTTEDDVFGEYFIPKGTVVVANQWSMLNDEREYGPNPHSFNPDRFIRPSEPGEAVEINPSVRHPNKIAFGFGRRSCPGSHLAEQTLWLAAACLLTVFEFEAPEREKANYIGPDGKVDPRFDPGFLCHRQRYDCNIKLRSPKAANLLAELAMGF